MQYHAHGTVCIQTFKVLQQHIGQGQPGPCKIERKRVFNRFEEFLMYVSDFIQLGIKTPKQSEGGHKTIFPKKSNFF